MSPQRKRRKQRKAGEDCIVPPALPIPALGQFVLGRSEPEERAAREYVELQAPGETVTHLEKITSERLFGRKLDAWDVRTTGNRYWVITNPTNLYAQELFPSLDYTISFHVGVTARIEARQKPPVSDEEQQRFAAAWRRWMQAAEAVDVVDEAEEFQAVGMRCRECLLEFTRAVADENLVPEGQDAPKRGDFIRWSELAAQTVARGSSAEEGRDYLKTISKATWQLVNWLTHARNAVRSDGHMAVDATQNCLAAFGMALVRHERGEPDRCPACSSYRLSSEYRPDLDVDPPYVTRCESCGWVDATRQRNYGDDRQQASPQ